MMTKIAFVGHYSFK